VERMDLAQGRDQWRALMKRVMKLRGYSSVAE
jgi:hypothetical protein